MIRTRKTFVIVAVVGSLLFGATAAFAQETPADTPQAARQADGPAKSRFGAFVLRQTMAFLDVTQGEVVSTLARGGTLAQLAEEQGSSGDELAAALLAVVDRHLQHAVATGRITEDQAAEHLARAERAIRNAVFEPHHPSDRGDRQRRTAGGLLATVMDVLDVNRGEIVSTLARGGTLAQLAEEQGSSGDELAAALLAVVDRHLQHAVATGRITEDQAAEHLARAEERIARIVFEPHHRSRGSDSGNRPI